MRTMHGPKVTFLVINMDFSVKGKVVLEMQSFLQEIVNEFKRKVKKEKTPASNDLFVIINKSYALRT